ncbi:MAG: sigma-70 family RNA polymerase sigma factor, partial [Nitrospinae bacterium]|nr:sigma-70 family RNA polymerase sigma factor [Nitrospinota bacterium]
KGAKFTTWFHRVVFNLCLDYNRKKTTEPLPDEAELPCHKESILEELESKEKQTIVDSCFSQLKQRQQRALNLCYYEGISHKEAAEIMELDLKALQSLLIRGKQKLRKLILKDRRSLSW